MTAREYRNERIAVRWEAPLCIHSRHCVVGAPEVFDPDARPWIDLDGADPDKLASVIARCPTGALHFERLDGGANETPDDPPTVRTLRDGPLYLRGEIQILDADGELIRRDTRLALCRCGHSDNKPFCDNSHLEAEFEAG